MAVRLNSPHLRTMLEHLEKAVEEVATAAALVLRSPGAATIGMLKQALELLDMSSGAVEDDELCAAGDNVLHMAADFLQAVNGAPLNRQVRAQAGGRRVGVGRLFRGDVRG
jgi:hypothetical protein